MTLSRYYSFGEDKCKHYILLLSIFALTTCFSISLSGQSISRQVIGITGGQSTLANKGITISWTMGEVAVKHIKSLDKQGSITEGFHQPNLKITNLSNHQVILVKIAPNPVIDILNIRLENALAERVQYNLLDVQGRILQRARDLNVLNTELDLSNYPAGTYFLQLSGKDKESTLLNEVHKIVKIK